jgi:hypothetical protein
LTKDYQFWTEAIEYRGNVGGKIKRRCSALCETVSIRSSRIEEIWQMQVIFDIQKVFRINKYSVYTSCLLEMEVKRISATGSTIRNGDEELDFDQFDSMQAAGEPFDEVGSSR